MQMVVPAYAEETWNSETKNVLCHESFTQRSPMMYTSDRILASSEYWCFAGLTIGGALTIQHITDALEKYQKEHSGLQWPTAA